MNGLGAAIVLAVLAVPAPAFAQAALSITSDPTGISVHTGKLHPGLAGHEPTLFFETFCVTPCSLSVAPGEYRFGYATGRGTPLRTPPIVLQPGSSRIAVRYHDRSGKRLTGYALMVGGAAAGSLLVTAGSGSSPTPGLVGLGAGVGLAGLVAGITVYALNPDRIEVKHSGAVRQARLSPPSGVGIRGRF